MPRVERDSLLPLEAYARERQAFRARVIEHKPATVQSFDEVRVAIEERASMSPDALTGMEANLRFAGPETMETKIFGRLTAWQNWVFSRPNAIGPAGALRRYGSGQRASLVASQRLDNGVGMRLSAERRDSDNDPSIEKTVRWIGSGGFLGNHLELEK